MSARVLVVDDVEANVRLLEAKLTIEYFDVVSCHDGATALSLAAEAQPDLILLDVMMPGMDGHQALEGMRHLGHERGVSSSDAAKVIMISALDDTRNVYRAFFQGQALTFLAKPFTCDAVLDELRRFDIIGRRTPAAARSDA